MGGPSDRPHDLPAVTVGQLAGFGDCSLAFGENDEKLCAWDGRKLTGTKRRWCRKRCREAFEANHWWNIARQVTLARDGWACVRCLANGDTVRLHKPDSDEYDPRKQGDYMRARVAFETERKARHLEVNHIEPRFGAGYGAGCHHHIEGLETLCRPHHQEATNEQANAREVRMR